MTCFAKQYSDSMVCTPCELEWDMNDPNPPRCLGEVFAEHDPRFYDIPFKKDCECGKGDKIRSKLPKIFWRKRDKE